MDKDIISKGAVQGPLEFFLKIGEVRHQLIRIQNECDVHGNALATTAIALLDEALDTAEVTTGV